MILAVVAVAGVIYMASVARYYKVRKGIKRYKEMKKYLYIVDDEVKEWPQKPDEFAEEYLGIKLGFFQKIYLRVMGMFERCKAMVFGGKKK